MAVDCGTGDGLFGNMAIALNKAVVRGVIDNTERGSVRGEIWLTGRAEPLVLDLRGNAWRDVAGARVTFVNPHPRPQKSVQALSRAQSGLVGDITASRKVNEVNVDGEEWSRLLDEKQPVPMEWRNAVYLEWFSAADGRVVIESTDFEIQITDFAWEMDEAEDQAQQLMNQHAMRDWLATVIQRPEPREEDGEGKEDDENAFTEAAWEESMKLSDRVNTAHMEALDKYGDDDEDESRVAFVMGWDHLLDAMADDSANDGRVTAGGAAFDDTEEDDIDPEDAGEEWKTTGEDEFDDEDEDDEVEDDETRGEDDFESWMEQRKERRHPLVKEGSALVTRILKDLKDLPASEDEDEEELADTPLDRFLSNTLSISGKLAGALGSPDYAEGMEAGHTLAILKRCLNWSNEALAGLNDLLADPQWEARHTLFSEYKRDLHAIRDAITDLRHEIRQANPGV